MLHIQIRITYSILPIMSALKVGLKCFFAIILFSCAIAQVWNMVSLAKSNY